MNAFAPPAEKINLLVAVTGASGSIYAQRLLNKLENLAAQTDRVGVIFSKSGKEVWQYELDSDPSEIPFQLFDNNDFFTPPASGSGRFNAMVIIPCTMGTMASVAHGLADNLISRAADVMLKERRKLVIVPREMPFNLIHIRNMELITLAGGIICPAAPSFYSKPQNVEDAIDTVVNKALQLAGFYFPAFSWGEADQVL